MCSKTNIIPNVLARRHRAQRHKHVIHIAFEQDEAERRCVQEEGAFVGGEGQAGQAVDDGLHEGGLASPPSPRHPELVSGSMR